MTADHKQCADVIKHEVQIKGLMTSDKNQWEEIKQIRNRPAYWVALLIALLMGVIGFLAKGGMD